MRERLLGSGGMGRVWLTRDTALNREVALKELSALRASQRAYFQREARLTAGLDHPGIVPVFDVGTREDGTPFYVMRVVRGHGLSQALETCRDAAERAALLDPLIETCQALAHAHALGVVHRDLKPENVMIGPFGEVQVVDWGLARIFSASSPLGPPTPPEPAGFSVGTPGYMSPEQAAGEPADARSDVWALGVILYELLSGCVPFMDRDPRVVIARVLDQPVPPVAPQAPRAPAELCAIAMRALARDRDARYPDAGAMLADLKAFRSGEHVSVYRYSLGEEATRLVRRHRRALLGLAAGLLVAVGATAVGFVRTAVQRDRAEAARAQMAAALQATRLEKAHAAMDSDDPVSALAFAGAALELGHDPGAVGIAAGLLGALPYRWAEPEPGFPGPCTDLSWDAARARYLCAGPQGVWVGGAEGVRMLDPGPATRASLSPDQRWVGIVDRRQRLRIADLDRGRDALLLEPAPEVLIAPVFDRDSQRVAWADGRMVHTARLPIGDAAIELLDTWNTGSLTGGLDWRGDHLQAWVAKGWVLDLDGPGGLREVSSGGFTSAQFDSRGEGLVYGTLAGAVGVVPPGTDEVIELRARGLAMTVGWSADERAVWAAGADGMEVWSLDGDSLLRLPALEPGGSLRPVIDDTGAVHWVGSRGMLTAVPTPTLRRTAQRAWGVTICATVQDALWCSTGGSIFAVAPGRPLQERPRGLPSLTDLGIEGQGLTGLCVRGDEVVATAGPFLAELSGPQPQVLHGEIEPLLPLACGPDGAVATAGVAGLFLWRPGEDLRLVPLDTEPAEVLAWEDRWLLRTGEVWTVYSGDGLPQGDLPNAEGSDLALHDGQGLAMLRPGGELVVHPRGLDGPRYALQVQPRARQLAWIDAEHLATYDGLTLEIHALRGTGPQLTLEGFSGGLSWWGVLAGQGWLLTTTHQGDLRWWDLGVLDQDAATLAARIRVETGFELHEERLVPREAGAP